jgi:hypothetical protein
MTRTTDERGVALVATLLVTMMMSAMVAGLLALVNADQAAGGIERDQTQAYAAAHAGVEKLTADLGQLFAGNFSPTAGQLAALTTPDMEPVLQGITYERPDGGPGYRITFTPDANGNPQVAQPGGEQIGAGPYQGLVGLITPYQVEVTSRTLGNAEVRMRREMQTIAIPVFQFGLFSENNLSFFAGPNFAFGGKIHTNQHLFLKQDGTNTLTLQDRVTAVGEIIRTHLSNGVTGTHNGNVRVARAPGCPAAPTAANASCFALLGTQGSLVGNLGSAQNEPTWTNVSVGTSNGWLRNGRTGARRLDLPIVSDGAEPVDLIRRPPVGENVTSAIARQRFYSMATLRILLSDTRNDITSLPGVVSDPVRLTGVVDPVALGFAGVPGVIPAPAPFAVSAANVTWGDRTVMDTPRIDGWLSVEMQERDGDFVDVTREILSLGFIGRRLSRTDSAFPDDPADPTYEFNQWLNPDDDSACELPHANAILRFQRTRDTEEGNTPLCGHSNATKVLINADPARRYWPNVLYDAREGSPRDSINTGDTKMWWSGVMHYVEFDVNNFRRWLLSEIGTGGRAGCANGAGGDNCPMDVTGYVVYFSDRRTNRNLGADGVAEASTWTLAAGDAWAEDRESGEFGWEDNINPGSAMSLPNNVLDVPYQDAAGDDKFAEDLNDNGVLDNYGGLPRLLPAAMMLAPDATCPTPENGIYELTGDNRRVDPDVARVNRAFFFRRALKLVNGGRGNLPANGPQGLTVAAENPVYIQGNYNACSNGTPNTGNNWEPNQAACAVAGANFGFGPTPGVDHVSAAVIADAVTLLSNRWNDIRSFREPYRVANRQASTTWYRLAIIAGKHHSFPRPNNNGGDHTDFGTDGGAHNFIRYIESWNNETLMYRGSLISFYTSRQAVGLYKCCDNVYSPPTRGYNFDTDFLTPLLLPPRTPMFRDINTLTFRQILRPTQ